MTIPAKGLTPVSSPLTPLDLELIRVSCATLPDCYWWHCVVSDERDETEVRGGTGMLIAEATDEQVGRFIADAPDLILKLTREVERGRRIEDAARQLHEMWLEWDGTEFHDDAESFFESLGKALREDSL